MCSTMFLAALFVITRTWKQPKHPLTKERIKKILVHLHNGGIHSRKNNDILKFAGKWTDLENVALCEVTQTQKNKYHMYSLKSGS